MSVLFTDVMTIYNYHRDETDAETWQRSVVRGVQWTHGKRQVTISGTVAAEKRVESITIDFQRSYGNKPYLPPIEFHQLSNEERAKYWTLDSHGKDIVVLGDIDKEVDATYRIKNLKDDFQYAVTVTSASDRRNRSRLKHIRVVCE